MTTDRKSLDLGCGNKKRPGAIGIDINKDTDADIVHDLNRFPYPFEASFFDEIVADNVLEHLDNVLQVMEELHRISKPNAQIKIILPYFRSRWAFMDPTHRHFFGIDSFAYFDPNDPISKMYNYSRARFSVERRIFNEGLNPVGPLAPLQKLVTAIGNRWPSRYEFHLSHLFPLDQLTFYLRVLK